MGNKKSLVFGVVAIVVALLFGVNIFDERSTSQSSPPQTPSHNRPDSTTFDQVQPEHSETQTAQRIAQAFAQQANDVAVEGSGRVKAILKDDLKGSRHQKFILQLVNGQTVLVAHNIDLAPRIDGLKKGDRVGFKGDYEYSAQGGVIHWTHRDPSGRHLDGWLKHQGKTYQ